MLADLEIPGALWRDPDMWARLALDMSFYTIIPLVLLSIISGIIIDGFGELRDEQAEAKQYREETSVVCGVSRQTMEQFSPGSFDKHMTSDQNPHHYIFLLLHLELQDPAVDLHNEAFVRSQIRSGLIDFLPKGTAMCLQSKGKEARDQGNEQELMVTMLKSLHVRMRSMEKDIRWMQAKQNIALRPLDDTEKALVETGKDDWLGASFGALPNFSFAGLGDVGMPTLPDMSMKGIKLDMPAMSIPELKIPGLVLFAPAELHAM